MSKAICYQTPKLSVLFSVCPRIPNKLQLTILTTPFIAYHAPNLTGCSIRRYHICVTAIKAGAIKRQSYPKP